MAVEERVASLENVLARLIEQSSNILAAQREDIAAVREGVAEIVASNARTDRRLLQIAQQAETDRKDFNKRLAGGQF